MKKSLLFVLVMSLFGCAVNKSQNNDVNSNDINALNSAIKHNPKDANLYLSRAKFYTNNNMLDNAQNDYKSALQLSPSNNNIKSQYADFLCYKKGDQYSASVFYSELIKNESAPIDTYLNYANCENNVGNMDGALDIYVRALALSNPPLSAYKGVVDIYMKQGNYAVANYYAELYKGTPTEESLKMQIDTLSSLLMSKQKINNKAELELDLSKLKKQYNEMSGNKYNDTPVSNIKPLPVIEQPINVTPVVNTQVKSSIANKAVSDSSAVGDRIKVDSSGRKYIIVAPSETLYRIYVYTKVPVATLEKLNNLKNVTIKTGDKIFIN
ncbi:MAG: hypothetical protein PHC75_02090 [Burkholderiales bacterium]|nr:hypothetical protein [Burkholderiales bacterium]